MTLTIKSQDELTTILSVTGNHLTIETGGIVRWVIATGESTMAGGNYVGQFEFTGTGIVNKSYRIPVYVEGSLT